MKGYSSIVAPSAMVPSAIGISTSRKSRVNRWAEKASGNEIAIESAAMLMTEPRPNAAMYARPRQNDPAAAEARTTSAADPAMPCTLPTMSARRLAAER